MHKKPIFLLLSILLLSACRSTPAPTPAPTTTFTPTPSQTVTPTLTPTRTPIPTMTLSPTSTYNSEEIQTRVADLLITNGNCEYPCWWGLMPGETNFYEARSFIKSLALESNMQQTDQRVYYAKIPVPESVNEQGYLYFEMMREKTANEIMKYQFIWGYFYPMIDILEIFGEPSEIHFSSPLIFPSNVVKYELFLYFPQRGALVLFSSATETPDPENAINLCDLDTQIMPSRFIGFIFWNPQESVTFDELLKLPFFSGILPPFSPIEIISNMTPHTFYLNFSQPNPECLVVDTALYGSQTD